MAPRPLSHLPTLPPPPPRRLLEGLEIYGSNWPKVAEHVGTHGMLETITHFLQLPIEDDFLDEIERRAAAAPGVRGVTGDAAAVGVQSAQEEDEIGRVPLCGTGEAPTNPVLASVRIMMLRNVV